MEERIEEEVGEKLEGGESKKVYCRRGESKRVKEREEEGRERCKTTAVQWFSVIVIFRNIHSNGSPSSVTVLKRQQTDHTHTQSSPLGLFRLFPNRYSQTISQHG